MRAERGPGPRRVSATEAEAGFLTIVEAARLTGVSRGTITGWIARGYLPTRRVDRQRRIRPGDLVTAYTVAQAGGVIPAWRRDRRRAGMRLRALREAAGLTQLELAARSGLTHEAISRLKRGRRAPLAASVRKLARALAVAPVMFVAADEVREPRVTVAEAARVREVPASRIQTWLAVGELAGAKVSGRWRVSATAVAELLASGRLRGRSRRLDPRYRG